MTGREHLGPGAAYAAQVQDWLQQAYQAQALQIGFYTFLTQQASSSGLSLNSTQPGATTLTAGSSNAAEQRTQIQPGTFNTAQAEQRIYTIPPVWKRIVAEALDIFLLFTLKVMITFTAVDFFQIISLDTYDFLNIGPNDPINIETLDYNAALEFTTELLILELAHRIVVCLFEAFCTFRGQRGGIGGATPGKIVMGLKIVKCDQVVSLGGNRVLTVPGGNLGLCWALVRSFIKNVSLAIFFPICFSLFLPNSRTLHDVISRSIVVENEQRQNRM